MGIFLVLYVVFGIIVYRDIQKEKSKRDMTVFVVLMVVALAFGIFYFRDPYQKSLIEHFKNGGLDFNATDIKAIEHLLLKNKIQQDTIKTQKCVINNLSDRIKNAKDRLNSLITFWKKYNPVDNTMQVGQFDGVIKILDGDIDDY